MKNNILSVRNNTTTSTNYNSYRRYYLERLSNDMGEVSYVSLDHPIPTGYYPTMRFRNGLAFPQRETGAMVPLHMQKYVQVNTFLNINNNIMR